MAKIQTIGDLKNEMAVNENLQQEFKDNPVKAIQQLEESIPDTPVYRIVVISLGTAVLLVIVGMVTLSITNDTIDPSVTTLFTAIASGAIGALAGLLAPTPKK